MKTSKQENSIYSPVSEELHDRKRNRRLSEKWIEVGAVQFNSYIREIGVGDRSQDRTAGISRDPDADCARKIETCKEEKKNTDWRHREREKERCRNPTFEIQY